MSGNGSNDSGNTNTGSGSSSSGHPGRELGKALAEARKKADQRGQTGRRG